MPQLKTKGELFFSVADKGLGICAVKLPIYISWCLKHLTDASTYTLLSKEQAWKDIYKLRDEILSRPAKHSDVIGPDAALYTREDTENNIKDERSLCLLLRVAQNPQSWTTRQQNQTC